MPISGNSDVSTIVQHNNVIPLQSFAPQTTVSGALLQTSNTTQSLTTLPLSSSNMTSSPLAIRSSSFPVVSQPDDAWLDRDMYYSAPVLPTQSAVSGDENLWPADDKDIMTASGSLLPKNAQNTFQGNAALVYQQLETQHSAENRALPAEQRSRLPGEPAVRSKDLQSSIPADQLALASGGTYFENIKFDTLYSMNSSAKEKRNELIKLCASASKGTRVDVSGINLQQVDLSDLSMNGFILDAVNFTGCNMTKTQLQGASLVGAVFGNAILNETNLSQSDLTFASVEKTVMTDALMHEVKIRGAKMSDAQLPKDITLKLPDDYLKNGVPDSDYFKQVTESAYSLGKLDKKTRQSLYNQLWTSIQELGNEEFYEAHRSVLIDAQVKDTDPSQGGDGKGSIYQMVWETIWP